MSEEITKKESINKPKESSVKKSSLDTKKQADKNISEDSKDPGKKKLLDNQNLSEQKTNDSDKKKSQSDLEKKPSVKKTESDKDNTKGSETKSSKTLTSNSVKPKKAIDLNNNQNDSKVNQNDSSTKNIENNDYVEKLVSINRVAKVVKGGRRFSFAALVVVGDGNGLVGHGKGKAKEVPEAIKKATDEAKNTMIRVPLRQGRTLHHDIKGRFDSGKVYLRSAPSGTGVIAGGPMRAVFEALGIQDIVAKSVGTSNPHNMVRATFEALKSASSPKIIAVRRSLKINDITKRRKISQRGDENAKN